MSFSNFRSPTNKKEYLKNIGRLLVKKNGKKKYYTPEEVSKAHQSSIWYDFGEMAIWAMSVFTSETDFNRHHYVIEKAYSYSEMKTEMLNGLSTSEASELSLDAGHDIKTSWLDFGDVFEDTLEGIGEFIGSILEAFDL